MVERFLRQVQEVGGKGAGVLAHNRSVLRAVHRADHLVDKGARLPGPLDELLHLRDGHLLGGHKNRGRGLLQDHHRKLGERNDGWTNNKLLGS